MPPLRLSNCLNHEHSETKTKAAASMIAKINTERCTSPFYTLALFGNLTQETTSLLKCLFALLWGQLWYFITVNYKKQRRTCDLWWQPHGGFKTQSIGMPIVSVHHGRRRGGSLSLMAQGSCFLCFALSVCWKAVWIPVAKGMLMSCQSCL